MFYHYNVANYSSHTVVQNTNEKKNESSFFGMCVLVSYRRTDQAEFPSFIPFPTIVFELNFLGCSVRPVRVTFLHKLKVQVATVVSSVITGVDGDIRHKSAQSLIYLVLGIPSIMFCLSFQRSCRPLINKVKIDPILKNVRTFSVGLTTESKKKVTQRPIRIILVRHGESLGNVDESAYVATPDWRVPLTDRGRQQAYEAGKELSDIIGKDGKVFFYYSPYKRTRETVAEFQKHIDPEQIISTREEPRMSEQQFGNFQNVEQVLESKQERHEFGRFYYRFKSGEAGLDVYSRVSSFISTLVRDCQQYQKAGYDLDTINVVIVTHGLSLRLFLMRWFQVS